MYRLTVMLGTKIFSKKLLKPAGESDLGPEKKYYEREPGGTRSEGGDAY
jgi:hypothetical protein